MSLPNLWSGNTSGDSDLMGRSLNDVDEPGSSSSAEEPGFRARSDFESDSGLDGFASEENDSDASWRPLAPGRTSEGDAARPAAASRTEHEPAPDRRPRANVVSLASRGRAKIGTVVPRLIHTARLDRIGSTVALVGQTGARVTHSLSATLTRPRRRIDYRLAVCSPPLGHRVRRIVVGHPPALEPRPIARPERESGAAGACRDREPGGAPVERQQGFRAGPRTRDVPFDGAHRTECRSPGAFVGRGFRTDARWNVRTRATASARAGAAA